jgi:hypothetical protein
MTPMTLSAAAECFVCRKQQERGPLLAMLTAAEH